MLTDDAEHEHIQAEFVSFADPCSSTGRSLDNVRAAIAPRRPAVRPNDSDEESKTYLNWGSLLSVRDATVESVQTNEPYSRDVAA
jgi:hypothetical protein